MTYREDIQYNPDINVIDDLITLFNQGQFDNVATQINQLLHTYPNSFVLWNLLGAVYTRGGELKSAEPAFRKAVECNPNSSDVHYNLGTNLKRQGKNAEAISSFQHALIIKPDHTYAHYNMGNTFKDLDKLDEAIAAYERALAITPDYAEAALNMGLALQDQGKLLQAIDAYRRTLAIKPDYHSAKMYLRHMLGHVCDWQFYHQDQTACLHLGVNTSAIPTFAMLAIEDNPARQLARSRTWAKERYKEEPLPLPNRPTLLKKRLRVGYFSADFHDHATLHLMAGLLHNHDKSHFDIYLYSYGKHKSECWRKKLEKSGCRFFDCAQETDIQVLTLARTHNLDIAIDLKGYTQDTRSDIFQYRLAPIQVNYLGYPGSMAAKFIDYIVADPVIIPEQQRKHYSESVIYMPNSYQPTDNMRKILHTHTTRADFGLPKEAFIFCCFNNNYKISPYEFDIWMRTLSKVPGSVLWLIRSNKWVEQNLYREAEARSIDPSRIIFAEKVAHSEHLARHKHADLFLDTFNVNAHTTASDALWTGLPLITKVGDQFAARVSASLLTAVGLPELITTTAEDYETLILDFAQNPEKLIATKQKLTANLMKFPLFDTKLYTKNFERALKKAYYLYFNNQEPKDIFLNN
jgi:protein O-GlcNAc transferase